MSNNMLLNRLFTRNIFMDLINENDNSLYSTCVERYVNNITSTKNRALISEIYNYLKKEYRNEYYYKNTLLNKLLLGRHSLNTTTALSEIPINKSKADFVLINGKATVYEIKTELDTFDRLDSQLHDYYKAFNNVCVVTSESNYQKAKRMLEDTNVGICILTDRNTISTRQKPQEDNSKLDHTVLFKVLRKYEFENILLSHYGKLPVTSQVKYYKTCYKMFASIEIDLAYRYVIQQLKQRGFIEIDEYKSVPYELKFMVYFSKYRKNDYLKLNNFLIKHWRG
ncbi:sce7726 family protein [Guptibacillus spartinae]|uniref:sce7726 family protein n=1 Tax=Guptibacillus spartinae TaxID=3025679 RepID=UPI0023624D99|nr:sce7726 family protein [Pseudalkalibacillus spartinae]